MIMGSDFFEIVFATVAILMFIIILFLIFGVVLLAYRTFKDSQENL